MSNVGYATAQAKTDLQPLADIKDTYYKKTV